MKPVEKVIAMVFGFKSGSTKTEISGSSPTLRIRGAFVIQVPGLVSIKVDTVRRQASQSLSRLSFQYGFIYCGFYYA